MLNYSVVSMETNLFNTQKLLLNYFKNLDRKYFRPEISSLLLYCRETRRKISELKYEIHYETSYIDDTLPF